MKKYTSYNDVVRNQVDKVKKIASVISVFLIAACLLSLVFAGFVGFSICYAIAKYLFHWV
jgi:hypothetical protein